MNRPEANRTQSSKTNGSCGYFISGNQSLSVVVVLVDVHFEVGG